MRLPPRFWAISIFLLSLWLCIPRVNAQPYFTVYPTEGSVDTDIFLQIRGLPGTGFYEVYYLYIFWDDILLGTFPDNSQTYDHYFDTHFSPPNRDNYASLGNHTVYFKVWNAGRNAVFINATFDFTIIEYVPCPEYLALNATYYNLLAEYETLSMNYTSLLADYGSLLIDHTSLLDDYDSLLSNYSSLHLSFLSLSADSSSLTQSYSQLQSNYNSLKTNYDSLKALHDNLKANLDSLESNNSNLATSYDALIRELIFTRTLSYLFAATTMVLVATTVYFAFRKPK